MLKRFGEDEKGATTILTTTYFILIMIIFWLLLLNFQFRGSGLNATQLMADAATRAGTVANAVEKQYSVREHNTGNLDYDYHVYTQLNRDESLKNVTTILEAWDEEIHNVTDITFGDSTSNMTIPIWSYVRHGYDEVLPPKDANINYKYDNGVCGIWLTANGLLIEPETLALPQNSKYGIYVESQAAARGSVTKVHR